MLTNYFKIVLRSIKRQRFYFFINIFGLSIGMAATILILLYISDELSYDRFHEDAGRIYRVGIKGRLAGRDFNGCTSSAPMAAVLPTEIPEIEEAIRIIMWRNVVTRFGDKSFTEPEMILADSNFFNFFSFQLREGNADDVLRGPNKLVLTETTAKRYFGYAHGTGESPVGKIIKVGNGDRTCMITGIVADPPPNSHFHFQLLMSMDSWDFSRDTGWTSNNFNTYFKVYANAHLALEEKFEILVAKYVAPEIYQFMGLNLQEFRSQGGDYGFVSEKLTDIHLYSTLDDQLEPGGNIDYLYIFGSIALFIIVIACINFMNLATARAASRAKEVGIRKTIGAQRAALIRQFFAESILYSILSLVIAVLLIVILLPSFNSLAGKSVTVATLLQPAYSAGLILLTLLVGLGAGIYPAIYLTSFKPVEVLKGKIRAGLKSGGIRNALVILQFSISIVLIISTILVFQQLNFLQNKNLGFKKENVLVLDNLAQLGNNQKAFKDWLQEFSGIRKASFSSTVVPHMNNNSVFRPVGENAVDNLFFYYFVDEDHLEAMGMEMVAGRFFSSTMASDTAGVILNEAAMRQLGWENYEDKKVLSFFNSEEGSPLNVIGVVKDFNFESMRVNVRPLLMLYQPQSGMMTIRLKNTDVAKTVEEIGKQWKLLSGNAPFEYVFLDSDFDALFRSEKRMGSIFLVFTVLAILIACLGLFGLAMFTTEQRAKEIGIRKIMGASVTRIVALFSGGFTRLVLISFAIAAPVVYYAMNEWLNGFAYRISIGIVSIIAGGLIALVVTWLTISFQSIKAARANPVQSLRSE